MTETVATRARLEASIDALLGGCRARGRMSFWDLQELARLQRQLSQLARDDQARRLAS